VTDKAPTSRFARGQRPGEQIKRLVGILTRHHSRHDDQHRTRTSTTAARTTFICGKSRRGAFQLQRKTRRDRMRAKLQEIKAELRQRMHQTTQIRDTG
jgi:hypothetical protein